MFTLLLLLAGPALGQSEPAFLVLAPDRGFLGNEEIREVFAEFREDVPASALAFVTSGRTAYHLERALDTLIAAHAPAEVVVLPLFVTAHEARYALARRLLDSLAARPGRAVALRHAEPLGASYLAEEILFDRVAALVRHPGAEHLVLVAGGAADPAGAGAIRTALQTMVQRAVARHGLAGGDVVVTYDGALAAEGAGTGPETARAAVETVPADRTVLLVPFNLAPRLTTMMSDWNRLLRALGAGGGHGHHGGHGAHGPATDRLRFDGKDLLPHPNIRRWLVRTANTYRPLARNQIGVIVVPHGSDYDWNETMRAGIAPLRDRYRIEEAFSMMDPAVVERAVRRLEAAGMRAAVVVRIFGREESFREQGEYILGLRPEFGRGFPDRIASHLRFVTLGGVGTHPLFARALADRARALSTDPARETLILLAHGTFDDAANAAWIRDLETLAATIDALVASETGTHFRAVKAHTWREDWPDKREAAVRTIRAMVEEASRDGGTAIVLPARTAATGPAAQYLDGLTYRYGEGFAPHPAFTRWLEAMIEDGIARLMDGRDTVTSARH
ncbi:hypothetical protein GQ464_017595 [Rhodocaloribacter litoris]|uniref:hypothetical protein n=1 Tax=Rhodocaloribacter litoris TaxID=2558931 RepID=UPI00142492EA|nr:hypothetical protein [Rhodocaloribacter litoris]QXD15192.1 hypothetical protein GQ464_017595 [Rhodocaloribacter litoris]